MDDSRTRFLPFDTTDIDEPSLSASKKEINESPETIDKCLQILREDLRKLKDIQPRLDNAFLLSFLRVSKFNPQRALKRIQTYYRQFDVLLEAFKDCSLSLEKARSFNHVFTTPYRLENNSFILVALNSPLDYRKCTFAERFYLDILANHYLMENPVNQITGVTLVMDFDGLDLYGYLAYTPRWTKLFLDTFMKIFPCRVSAIHAVNTPPLFSFIYNLGYRLLPKKIQKRVFVHSKSDWRSFHSLVPADILPERFGGKVENGDMINCLEDIEEMERLFLKSFVFGSVKNRERRKSMKIIC